MFNEIHKWFHRPASGWDPVSYQHALSLSTDEWDRFNFSFVDHLENIIGCFKDKRVLDLGAGSGQYAINFALRGANVVWHDISQNYLSIAKEKALEYGVEVEFSLGYMEEAIKYMHDPFDFIFNRICWYYCINDSKFARLIWKLLKPGGFAYIDTNNDNYIEISGIGKVVYALNRRLDLKIGHPLPPRDRIVSLIKALPISFISADLSSTVNDRVLFQKAF